VFRKNGFLKDGDACKPLILDKMIPNHALKCHAQLAVPRTFLDLVGMNWQDHAWSFRTDWITKRWVEPKEGSPHKDGEGPQNQEEHPDGRTTGGSGGLEWSEEQQPMQETKGSTWLIVKWIATGTRMMIVTIRGEHRNNLITTEWVAMLMMVRALLGMLMVRVLLAHALTYLQSIIIRYSGGTFGKPVQQPTARGKTSHKGGTRLPWPKLKVETQKQQTTNDKSQLPNVY